MGTPAVQLAGRDDELERLKRAFAMLSGGIGSVVLIEGEAGSGKTRLLSHALTSGGLPRPVCVVTAAALDYAPAPYAPIRDVVGALDERNPKVLGRDPALAQALAPILDLRGVADADAGERRRTLDAVRRAIERFAANAPLVIAVEDVHWIDRASADVLLHLTHDVERLRVCFIFTYRSEEAEPGAPSANLIAHVSRAATVSLRLAPLADADVRAVVEDVAGRPLTPAVRDEICRLAGGNPLLAVELTKHAVRDPAGLAGTLPISLEALVRRRLRAFEPHELDVLRVAATMGEFDAGLLSEISGVSAERVAATLRAARDLSLVAETGGAGAPFVFTHALVRRAVSDDMLLVERHALHARIAGALENAPDSVSRRRRLAHHYDLAGDAAKSAHYSALAAADARDVLAFDDAATLYERALRERDVDAMTFPLYEDLAKAYAESLRHDDAAHAFAKLFAFARQKATAADAARLAGELSRQLFLLLQDERSIEAVREGLALLDASANPELAFDLQTLLAWYLANLRRVDEAQSVLVEAAQNLHAGSPATTARYYEALAAVDVHSGRLERWREYLNLALECAERAGRGHFARRVGNSMALAAASAVDDAAFVEELYARSLTVFETDPWPDLTYVHAQAAWTYWLRGKISQAKAALDRAIASAPDSSLGAFYIARTGIPLAVHTADAVLLRRCTRPQLLDAAFASNDPVVFGNVAAAVSEQLRADRRESERQTLLSQTLKRLTSAANNLPVIVEAARARIAEARHGIELLERLAPSSAAARGALALSQAYMTSGEARRSAAARAAQIFGAIEWRMYEASALELCGRSEAALSVYEACGARADVARLRKADRRIDVAPHGLSPREWEIAQLVAHGNSNRSIAEKLALSERTVENHIASVFTKLNVRSRAEIASYVARDAATSV